LSALIKHSRLFITWHEVWRGYWREYLGPMGLLGGIMEKTILLALADRVIAVSDQTKDDLIRLGVDAKKINVVPNGVDFTHIQKVGPAKERSDVVFLGRLIKPKNINILIQAISVLKKDLPRVRVSIIGSGPERKSLERLAKELRVQKNVRFHGFVEDFDEVLSLMKASKVFVIPSIQEGGASIVTQEANACGLPVIAVDHPLGIDKRLIKQGTNGFFVRLAPDAIADKIKLLLQKKSLLKEMSAKSMRFVKKWDWDNITKTLEKVYES
jgi:glycosyltransferase involved in cell wall biosynthesis